jgi:hypothetical protein
MLAMGIRIAFPFVQMLVMRLLLDDMGMEAGGWRIYSLFASFIYCSASAVVWGLVLFAIFGRDGIVHPPTEPDDDYQ